MPIYRTLADLCYRFSRTKSSVYLRDGRGHQEASGQNAHHGGHREHGLDRAGEELVGHHADNDGRQHNLCRTSGEAQPRHTDKNTMRGYTRVCVGLEMGHNGMYGVKVVRREAENAVCSTRARVCTDFLNASSYMSIHEALILEPSARPLRINLRWERKAKQCNTGETTLRFQVAITPSCRHV